MAKRKKMSNIDVFNKMDYEGSWSSLAHYGLKPKDIADPALRDKYKEYMNCYKVLLEIEEELVEIAREDNV
jgi:hypothetical protein